tara:strand:- start:172 stop:1788 length:1617 start_codon:yes stop_codon:yes gene_type:complete
MHIVILLSLCGYIAGMFNPIMEIDAMQFASMSREMLRGENFLHLLDNGQPYLDKPPLIFWVTALFFKFFGASDFVYRLPSILFSLITIYATYRFSRLYYSRCTALTSALILASCQAFFIMNADVRTDIYMIAPMMISVWQISAYFRYGKWSNLLLGSAAIGFAVMGKGPLGMMIPVLVFGFDLLLKGRMSRLLDIKLLWGLGVLAVCLLPMSYGLFTQFGTAGLKFFYWTQSFGRITGASSWSNDAGPFYLFSVFLYTFMPWTILFVRAFYARTKALFREKKISHDQEVISYAGYLIPLIMLSLSSYKLPHYIYCVAPFAAIVTAREIEGWLREGQLYRRLFVVQLILGLFLIVFVLSLSFYAFPLDDSLFIIPVFLLLIGVIFIHRSFQDKLLKFLVPPAIASIIVNYSLNVFFLAPLLTYQGPSQAAAFLKEGNYSNMKIYLYQEAESAKSRSFNYYLDQETVYIDEAFPDRKNGDGRILVYTGKKGYRALKNQSRQIETVAVFNHFRVSKLNLKFLDVKTRTDVLEKKYLLVLSP